MLILNDINTSDTSDMRGICQSVLIRGNRTNKDVISVLILNNIYTSNTSEVRRTFQTVLRGQIELTKTLFWCSFLTI